ncbi:hypothetical protein SprV_0802536900 [Sparganum proliferum]
MTRSAVEVEARLCHQPGMTGSPLEEDIVQKLTAPRWRLKANVAQEETVFCTGSQKEEAIVFVTPDSVWSQLSTPSGQFH